jgi:hypothetical protein
MAEFVPRAERRLCASSFQFADRPAGEGRLAAAALGHPARPASLEPLACRYVDVHKRHGHGNASKSAVARKILIAVRHVPARQRPSSLAA